MPPTPSGPPRYTSTQRRLLTVSTGLGVALLAGVAFVVTYGDLRALVVEGHAPRRFAPAYPVMFDVLITVTILALVVARNGRWWTRWPRWLLLLMLLGGAAAASVQRAVKGYGALPDEALKAGTAVAPHVMLLLAIWLWLAMFKQARTALARRTAPPAPGLAPAEDGSPTAEIPVDRPEIADSRRDSTAEHRPTGESTGDQPHGTPQETNWPNSWAPEEAPLDWALVPYEPESGPSYESAPSYVAEPPPPYEPDPAVQPYEPDPVPHHDPDPVLHHDPDPVLHHEPDPLPDLFPDTTGFPDTGFPDTGSSDTGFPDAGSSDTGFPDAGSSDTAGQQEPPTPVAPQSTLPTDRKLVGRPASTPPAATTRPDLAVSDDAEPGSDHAEPVGEPVAKPTKAPISDLHEDEDDADLPVIDRAEDPDAGDDHPVTWPALEPDRTAEVAWRPPSSTFRSSPTPPDE